MEICVFMLVLIGIVVYSLYLMDDSHNKEVKERNANRKAKLQEIFSEISIGMDYSVISDRFKECEAISTPNLVSEVVLENGLNRKVYVWHLDWEYVVSRSSSVGVMPSQSSTINPGGNGISFSNGTAMGFTNGQTTQKAFIQMVFENDKLVAKEQQGLYQDMIIG